jgi:hypothetical protein
MLHETRELNVNEPDAAAGGLTRIVVEGHTPRSGIGVIIGCAP